MIHQRGRPISLYWKIFENYTIKANRNGSGTKVTDVIEYDEKYSKLLHYLLEEVYLIEHENEATEANGKIYLTKNGKIIIRAFSISGGSVGLFEGKRIGRAKNLEKLSEEIKALSLSLNDINKTSF